MAGMPEEQMVEEGGEAAGGEMTALAKRIGGDLSKFSEIVNGSQSVTDQDREKMAMVMNGFIELVEKNLAGQAPGEDAPPEAIPEPGVVSATGGPKGVPIGPNTRM